MAPSDKFACWRVQINYTELWSLLEDLYINKFYMLLKFLSVLQSQEQAHGLLPFTLQLIHSKNFGLQWFQQPDHRGFRMKPDSSAKFKIRSLAKSLPHLQWVFVFSPPGCRLLLVPGFLPPEEADWIFSKLLAELPWSQKTNYRQGVFGMNEKSFICITLHHITVFYISFNLSLISAGLHHLSVAAVFLPYITASMFDNWSFISG